jgi:hypothetical protein
MIPAPRVMQLETQKAAGPLPFSKKRLLGLSCAALAAWSFGACAQSVWTYEVVGADNQAKITHKPPMDISYPAANQPMPIYNPNEKQGVLITAREEADRLNKPMLIILLGRDFQ